MTLFEGVMSRDWWQGRLCPSFIQFGYATPELLQRMQIYGGYDRCGYDTLIRINSTPTRIRTNNSAHVDCLT